MSAQPEALRIADECEQSAKEWLQEVETRKQAAAELRRLVAENDTLREDLRKFREAASCERDLRQEQERHATALVQQMLEALEPMLTAKLADGTYADKDCKITFAITAASEWLGQKGETK